MRETAVITRAAQSGRGYHRAVRGTRHQKLFVDRPAHLERDTRHTHTLYVRRKNQAVKDHHRGGRGFVGGGLAVGTPWPSAPGPAGRPEKQYPVPPHVDVLIGTPGPSASSLSAQSIWCRFRFYFRRVTGVSLGSIPGIDLRLQYRTALTHALDGRDGHELGPWPVIGPHARRASGSPGHSSGWTPLGAEEARAPRLAVLITAWAEQADEVNMSTTRQRAVTSEVPPKVGTARMVEFDAAFDRRKQTASAWLWGRRRLGKKLFSRAGQRRASVYRGLLSRAHIADPVLTPPQTRFNCAEVIAELEGHAPGKKAHLPCSCPSVGEPQVSGQGTGGSPISLLRITATRGGQS